MISLSDFQPLSIARINIFSSTIRVLQKLLIRYFRDKVHAILTEEVPVQNMLRDGASFQRLTSLIGLKYLHQPSNLHAKYSHINCKCNL